MSDIVTLTIYTWYEWTHTAVGTIIHDLICRETSEDNSSTEYQNEEYLGTFCLVSYSRFSQWVTYPGIYCLEMSIFKKYF